MTVSKSKPGAWALTLLLVLQEAEQELDGEEGPPQAGPEEEDGEWDPATRLHSAAPRGRHYRLWLWGLGFAVVHWIPQMRIRVAGCRGVDGGGGEQGEKD